MIVSLTTTPMMSARFLVPESHRTHGWFYRAGERAFDWLRELLRPHADLRCCAIRCPR